MNPPNLSSDKQKWGAWGTNNTPKSNTKLKKTTNYAYNNYNTTPHFSQNSSLPMVGIPPCRVAFLCASEGG